MAKIIGLKQEAIFAKKAGICDIMGLNGVFSLGPKAPIITTEA